MGRSPSSPTAIFRQQIRPTQPQPPPSSAGPAPAALLLMPLSATTGAAPSAASSSSSAASRRATSSAAASRTLRSRPADVDELGRKPGTVDLPGSTTGGSSGKRRKVDLSPTAAPQRLIPPPPPLADDDPDAEAEDAQEYNCPVCLCPPTQAVVTPCGHLLCFACLQKSLASNLIRTQQHPPPGPPAALRATPLNLEGDCPVCRVPLPGGLYGRVDRRSGKVVVGEGVRRIEVKLVDVPRPAGPPIELE